MAAPRLNPVTRNFVVPSLGVYAARAPSRHVWAENGRLSARGLGARGVPPRVGVAIKGGTGTGGRFLSRKRAWLSGPPLPAPWGSRDRVPASAFCQLGGQTLFERLRFPRPPPLFGLHFTRHRPAAPLPRRRSRSDRGRCCSVCGRRIYCTGPHLNRFRASRVGTGGMAAPSPRGLLAGPGGG